MLLIWREKFKQASNTLRDWQLDKSLKCSTITERTRLMDHLILTLVMMGRPRVGFKEMSRLFIAIGRVESLSNVKSLAR